MCQPLCIHVSMDLSRKLRVPLEADAEEPEWKLIGSAFVCYRNLFAWSLQQVQASYGLFFPCCSRSASALESWIFSQMCKYSVIMLWPSKSHIINTVAPFVNGSAASLFSFLLGSCGFAFVHVAFAPCRYMSKKVCNSDNVYASAHTCINTMYRLDSFSLAYTIPLRTL